MIHRNSSICINRQWFISKLLMTSQLFFLLSNLVSFDHRISDVIFSSIFFGFISQPFTVRRQGRPWTPRTPLIHRPWRDGIGWKSYSVTLVKKVLRGEVGWRSWRSPELSSRYYQPMNDKHFCIKANAPAINIYTVESEDEGDEAWH